MNNETIKILFSICLAVLTTLWASEGDQSFQLSNQLTVVTCSSIAPIEQNLSESIVQEGIRWKAENFKDGNNSKKENEALENAKQKISAESNNAEKLYIIYRDNKYDDLYSDPRQIIYAWGIIAKIDDSLKISALESLLKVRDGKQHIEAHKPLLFHQGPMSEKYADGYSHNANLEAKLCLANLWQFVNDMKRQELKKYAKMALEKDGNIKAKAKIIAMLDSSDPTKALYGTLTIKDCEYIGSSILNAPDSEKMLEVIEAYQEQKLAHQAAGQQRTLQAPKGLPRGKSQIFSAKTTKDHDQMFLPASESPSDNPLPKNLSILSSIMSYFFNRTFSSKVDLSQESSNKALSLVNLINDESMREKARRNIKAIDPTAFFFGKPEVIMIAQLWYSLDAIGEPLLKNLAIAILDLKKKGSLTEKAKIVSFIHYIPEIIAKSSDKETTIKELRKIEESVVSENSAENISNMIRNCSFLLSINA